jgi:hypothetical protein
MTDGRPHLRAVPDPPPGGGPAARPGARRSPWRLLLAGGLAVALLGWAFTAQENRRLRVSLHASRARLAEARAALEAYSVHVDRARESAASLRAEATSLAGRLADLEILLADEPGSAPKPAEPAAAPPAEEPPAGR